MGGATSSVAPPPIPSIETAPAIPSDETAPAILPRVSSGMAPAKTPLKAKVRSLSTTDLHEKRGKQPLKRKVYHQDSSDSSVTTVADTAENQAKQGPSGSKCGDSDTALNPAPCCSFQLVPMRAKWSAKRPKKDDSKIAIENKYAPTTKVNRRRVKNKREFVQCHRCQLWLHTASNCRAQPRCLKCGMGHWTYLCTKSKDTPAKCANCRLDHPANSTSCRAYTAIIEKRNSARPTATASAFNGTQQGQRPSIPLYPSPSTAVNTGSSCGEVLREIRRLQEVCDISQLMRRVRELTRRLQSCETDEEREIAVIEYTSSLSCND